MLKAGLHGFTDYLAYILIPSECFIWLSSRRPLLLALIKIAVLLFMITPCLFCCIIGFALLGEFFEYGGAHRLWSALGCICIPLAVMALVAWLIRSLLHRYWKPTPEMLAQNDEAVEQELREMEAQKADSPLTEEQKRVLTNAVWHLDRGEPEEDAGGVVELEHPDREMGYEWRKL